MMHQALAVHRSIIRMWSWLFPVVILVSILVTFGVQEWKIRRVNSNRDYGPDTMNNFKVAYINFGDKVKRIHVDYWRDFPTALNVQITDTNGVTYLTSYKNVVLISHDK